MNYTNPSGVNSSVGKWSLGLWTDLVDLSAFQFVLKSRVPEKLWTDKGNKFYKKEFKKPLRSMLLNSTSPKTKKNRVCSIAETGPWRRKYLYFSVNFTRTYLPSPVVLISWFTRTIPTNIVLPRWPPLQLVKKYWNMLENLTRKQALRITKKKDTFEKGHTLWTEEVFELSQVLPIQPPPYHLNDFNREKIQGSFYGPELQNTSQDIYHIEKVLSLQTRDDMREMYVKWKGYPNTFNSCIKASDVQ